jgi:hypothetical protein
VATFEVDRRIGKALHLFLQLDIPLAPRRENGDGSNQNKIVIRGPPPNRLSIRSPNSVAWLFALFSYYLSMKTNGDWFSRSGAVMGLSAAAVTFRLAHFYQRALATALKEGLVSVQRGIELRLEPPRAHVVLS